MHSVDELITELEGLSVRYAFLKYKFKGFQENIKSFFNPDAIKIKGVSFEIIDDESFDISFMDLNYKLVFSSVKDGDTQKGKITFFKVLSSDPMKKVKAITFNKSGMVFEHKDYSDRDGLDLSINSHCVNILLHWLYEDIKGNNSIRPRVTHF